MINKKSFCLKGQKLFLCLKLSEIYCCMIWVNPQATLTSVVGNVFFALKKAGVLNQAF